jgi:hypothetical protein
MIVSAPLPLSQASSITPETPLEFCLYHPYKKSYAHLRFNGRHFPEWCPQPYDCVGTTSIESGVLKNLGNTFGISLLAPLQLETGLLAVQRPPFCAKLTSSVTWLHDNKFIHVGHRYSHHIDFFHFISIINTALAIRTYEFLWVLPFWRPYLNLDSASTSGFACILSKIDFWIECFKPHQNRSSDDGEIGKSPWEEF